jgi:hypothetical protein
MSSAKPKVPLKWERVLRAFLSGRSFNRFQAARDLHDHCLHSTVSAIEGKGVRIARKWEKVSGYQDIPTDVTRYWLDTTGDNVIKARVLVGERLEAAAA